MELPAIMTKAGMAVDEGFVDYMGHYKGYPIALDAKECGTDRINIKTNFKPHQIQFLEYFKKTCRSQPIVISGFFILFYNDDPENLYYLDIMTLKKEMDLDKKSLLMEEIPIKFKMDVNFYEEIIKKISR